MFKNNRIYSFKLIMSTYLYKKRILKLSILFDVVLFESDSEEDFATHIVNECYDL